MASEKTNDSAGAGTRPPARETRNAGISRDGTAKFAKGARWGGSSYCEQFYKYLTRWNVRASLARGPATAGLRLCEHARPAGHETIRLSSPLTSIHHNRYVAAGVGI